MILVLFLQEFIPCLPQILEVRTCTLVVYNLCQRAEGSRFFFEETIHKMSNGQTEDGG